MRVAYELGAGCVHTLSLHAPYWVVNHTGLPISIREAGARHGFTGDEAAIVRDVVCENQQRPTVLQGYAPDARLPFSDERMQRRYANLAAVWLPPGWVWLDDAWDVDRTPRAGDAGDGGSGGSGGGSGGGGWLYAHSFAQSHFEPHEGFLSLVRQRRWFRHRALAAAMDGPTAARLSDDAILRMTLRSSS